MKLVRILTVMAMVCLLVISILPVHGEEAVYDNVIRLHVLANSDSEEDQSLKLRVRDAVLDYLSPHLGDCENREQAAEVILSQEKGIKETATDTLRSLGCEASVTVTLSEEGYPEKRYESLCFPSGTYLSLRVCIGEAEGENWWCVLFPSICTSVATVSKKDAEDAFVAVGFTPEQYRIVTETDQVTYRIKFKLLEFFESVFSKK